MTPLRHCFFVQRGFYRGIDEHMSRTCNLLWQGPWPLGMNPKVTSIALRVFAVMGAALILWCFRDRLMNRLSHRAARVMAFLGDRSVDARLVASARAWSLAFLVRSPGLVLVYAAVNDVLLVPGLALEPHHAGLFKLAQGILGVLVLTQAALPLCGALLIGTWLYVLAGRSWMAAVEVSPLLAVVVVYVRSPWQSHELAIPALDATGTAWLRRVLGGSMIAAGYLALYDYQRTAGMAEQMPAVMNDPLVRAVMMGHSEGFQRETWVIAFALMQVAGGFLVAVGAFTRVTSVVIAVMLARLIWVAFSWQEAPRLYQVAALMVLITSDSLTSDVDRLREQRGLALASSVAAAAAVIFPVLYWLSTIDRRAL